MGGVAFRRITASTKQLRVCAWSALATKFLSAARREVTLHSPNVLQRGQLVRDARDFDPDVDHIDALDRHPPTHHQLPCD